MKFFGNLMGYRSPLGLAFLVASSTLWAATETQNLEDKLFSSEATPEVTSESAGASSDTTVTEKELPAPESTSRSREREKKYDESVSGPKQIPAEHIFVVQNRYVRKEGLHELTPLLVGIQPGDSFRKQLQWGISYAYHFSESVGIEVVHANVITNYTSGLASSIRSSVSLETYRAEPVYSLGSALLWTPLHAKAATDDGVYHFEGYFALGGGVTRAEDTSNGMAMGGVGFRAYMSKRALFKVELRDYIDFGVQMEHRVNVLVGASILIGGAS